MPPAATVTGIAVSPATSTIAAGTSTQLKATAMLSDGTTTDATSEVMWKSSDATIASISMTGSVMGLKTGMVTITASFTLADGTMQSGSATVTVTSANLTAIAVTPTNPTIANGTTQQFTATGTFSDMTTQDISSQVNWTSSAMDVATVSMMGVATGMKKGTTTITATMGKISGNTMLTVTDAVVTSVAVTPSMPSIASGTTVQLTATATFSDMSTQDVTSMSVWATSDGSIATVNNAGLVTGAAAGTSDLTATFGGMSGTTTVTVTAATLVSIAVTPTMPSIAKGTTQQFTAIGTFTDKSTQDLTPMVTWQSSDSSVADISNASGTNGLATGDSAGMTTITATLSGVTSPDVTLTVTAATLVSIDVEPANASIAKGTTQQFTATGTYSDTTTQDLTTQVTWTVVGTSATISNASGSAGLATGIGAGDSTIQATLGTVTGSTTLTVSSATLVSIAVSPTNPSIAKGTTQQFKATGTYTDGSTQDLTTSVTWNSATATVASISNAQGSEGQASGLTAGTTVITATLGAVTSPDDTLTVSAATLVSIAVTPSNPSIAKGTTQQFTATGTYSDNSTQNLTTSVTWQAAGSAATISNASGTQGLASGVAAGTSNITATLGTVTSPGVTLTVTAATLVSIAVTPTNPTIAKGTSQQFKATGTYTDGSTKDLTTSVTWNATGSAASISNASGTQGLASGLAAGTSNVTATLGSVVSPVDTLTVTAATLVSIAVTPSAPSIAKGTTQQFTATGTFSDGSKADLTTSVTWAASGAATISNATGSDGLATGTTVGTATITASQGGITSPAITLTVTAATLVSIAVTPTNPTIAKGQTQQFHATGTYSDNSTQDLTATATWAATGSAASISNAAGSQGLASGLAAGSSNVTASVGAVTSPVDVLTVTAATLVSIAVTPSSPTIAKGTTQQFAATGTFSDNSKLDLTTSVTWAASGSAATISNAAGTQGLATGVSTGTSSITASSGGVTSPGVTLTVTAATLVSIAVTPPNPSVAKGQTQQFTATGTFSDGSTSNLTSSVTWSATGSAATISNAAGSQGLATGNAVGTSTITATQGTVTSPGVTLTVTAATLVSIAVTPTTPSIAKGTTQQFAATGTFSDGTKSTLTTSVTWAASGSAATISNAVGSQGLASGVNTGTSTITASQSGVTSPGVTLTVTAATLVSIAVTPVNPTIAKGQTQQFVATGTYTDGSTQFLTTSVTWNTSNGAAASISNAAGSQGLATGLAVGSTNITATQGAITSPLQVLTVSAATLVSIAVTPTTQTIAKGTTQSYTATGTFSDGSKSTLTTSVTWAASGSAATISNASGTQGVATGVAVGSSTITASQGGITSPGATLTVSAATLVSIAVSPTAPSIAKGRTQQFAATGTYTDGSTQNLTTSVTWNSSNGTTATISNAAGSQGLASGLAVGTTNISATQGAVTSPNVVLTVTAATLVSIAVTPSNPSIAKGQTQSFIATGTFSDSSKQDLTTSVTWQASDKTGTGVATISNASGSQGVASGLNVGTANVTATDPSSGIVSPADVLTVTSAVLTKLTVTPNPASVANGQTVQFTATGTFSDSSTQDLTTSVTWGETNGTGSATISNASGTQGLATGTAVGKSTITATSGAVVSPGVTLTITSAVLTGVTVSPTAPSIAKGTTEQFTCNGVFSDNTSVAEASASWAATDLSGTGVATIDPSGLATGTGVGKSTIKCTFGGFSNTTTLTVSAATLVSIAVSPTGQTIAKNTELQYAATGTFTDGSSQDLTSVVTWFSSVQTIATISNASGSNGLASGLTAGTTQIYAVSPASMGSIQSNMTGLTVTNAVLSSISIHPLNQPLAKGLTRQYIATGNFSDNTTQDLTTQVSWTTDSNGTITSISNAAGSQGLLTAVATGSDTIHATMNGVTGNASITVTSASVVSIDVEATGNASLTIAKGTTQNFTATALLTDGTTPDVTTQVTWLSSNGNATVSNIDPNQGLATGVAVGTAVISATLSGVTGQKTLTITNATLKTVDVEPATPDNLPVGLTQQFTATGIFTDNTQQDFTNTANWNSSTTAAQISSSGLATGVSTGTTAITATVGAVTSKTVNLTVTNPVLTALTITSPAQTVPNGLTLQVSATGTFSDGSKADESSNCTWGLADQSGTSPVANIDPNGLLTGSNLGVTDVTCTIGSVSSNIDEITVTNAVLQKITVFNDQDSSNPAIPKGTSLQFHAQGSFSDGTFRDLTADNTLTWASSDSNVADISNAQGSAGLATGDAVGSVTISATESGVSGTSPLTVTSAVLTSIAVTPDGVSIPKGRTQQYKAVGTYSDSSQIDITTSVTWIEADTSGTNVAVISNASGSEGLASGTNVGGASIYAVASSITSNMVSLTVTSAVLTKIDVTPTNPNVPKGLRQQFTATGTFSDSSTLDLTTSVTWTSSDQTVAIISNLSSSHGLATAVKVGTSTIAATDQSSGISGSTTMTVTAATLVSITVTPANQTIANGGTEQYTATGHYTDNSTSDLTTQVSWSSSDESIAIISNLSGSQGLATSVADGGPINITALATDGSGISGSTTLTVAN